MNANLQMLIDYIKMYGQFANRGGQITMATPPEGITKEQRKLVEQALPGFNRFNWRAGAVDCFKV